MNEPPPTPLTPDRMRALEALRVIIANGTPMVFQAQLESGREFYWVTVHYLVADISVLVANALGLTLDAGRFRMSIKEILDRLNAVGVAVPQYEMIEVEEEPNANP
jgi:hypothetical protein